MIDLSTPRTTRFALVILAAGASARMGQAKQLLPLAGKPLIVRAVESALAAPVWPIVVVLGAQAERIRPLLARLPVLLAENPAWAEGMASSLRTGLGVVREFSRDLDGVIMAVCDQPGLTADTLAQLIARQRETGRSVVAARYSNRLGVPALFLREHFPALASLTGEAGARDLINREPERVADVDLPELAVDLDTPSDYQAALRTLSPLTR